METCYLSRKTIAMLIDESKQNESFITNRFLFFSFPIPTRAHAHTISTKRYHPSLCLCFRACREKENHTQNNDILNRERVDKIDCFVILKFVCSRLCVRACKPICCCFCCCFFFSLCKYMC